MGEEYDQQQKKLHDGVCTFAKKDEMAFQLMVAWFISVEREMRACPGIS